MDGRSSHRRARSNHRSAIAATARSHSHSARLRQATLVMLANSRIPRVSITCGPDGTTRSRGDSLATTRSAVKGQSRHHSTYSYTHKGIPPTTLIRQVSSASGHRSGAVLRSVPCLLARAVLGQREASRSLCCSVLADEVADLAATRSHADCTKQHPHLERHGLDSIEGPFLHVEREEATLNEEHPLRRERQLAPAGVIVDMRRPLRLLPAAQCFAYLLESVGGHLNPSRSHCRAMRRLRVGQQGRILQRLISYPGSAATAVVWFTSIIRTFSLQFGYLCLLSRGAGRGIGDRGPWNGPVGAVAGTNRTVSHVNDGSW